MCCISAAFGSKYASTSCVAIVSIHAVAQPVYELDAFAIWALKAKVLAHESLWSRPEYFSDPAFSFSHQEALNCS